MKPLWIHTLAWIAAVLAALLLALAMPEGNGEFNFPAGATTPR
ncbi:MAG TPA: hypothetical protein VLK85_33445 [Ramlibacter sp.]|nr:hypothetical protein [Ramlibacter sp.]